MAARPALALWFLGPLGVLELKDLVVCVSAQCQVGAPAGRWAVLVRGGAPWSDVLL